ncbi:type II secretion system F family protein [Candidatus Micrarchaeota archaeon]|nr:type II secretion system F family protein [Candidatus Micrarchaeota archaeon]
MNRVYARLAELVKEEKKEKKIKPMLEFAGIDADLGEWIGKKIFVALLFGLIGLLVPWSVLKYFELIDYSVIFIPLILSVILAVGFFVLVLFLYYLHLYYAIDDRVKRVEAVLPDFLLLMASNMRAGMTPFLAFRSSARKEFTPLSEEVEIAASKSLGTESFREALSELTKRVNSRILRETVSFFAQSLKSGGHLAKMLETGANDITKTQEMKKELISSTKMYVLFVAFVIVIATPLLLSISVQFLEMISDIQSENPLPEGNEAGIGAGFLSSKISIEPEFMFNSSLVLLFGNALLASIFIGILNEGKGKNGLKYFIPILAASIILFFAFRSVVSGFLSFLG